MFKKSRICFEKDEEKGGTIVEVLGVLAIVGILSVGGVVSYRYAMQKKLVNDLIYAANMTNVMITHDIRTRKFSDVSEFEEFLGSYTRMVGKYKISFYPADSSVDKRNFGINIEMADGTSMPVGVCKGLILGMHNQHVVQAIDVKAGEEQRHIESGTIDVDTICGK